MNKINLSNLNLKTFTEQDVLDYCQINNINPDNIKELDLSINQFINITVVKLFKNLEKLWLYYNQIKDILDLKYLIKLKRLNLANNEIKDISVIKNLNNLETLNIRDL